MTRILIAAASDVARAGLASLLAGMPDLEIVGRVADPDALADALRSSAPDVVLVDVESRRDSDAALVAAALDDEHEPAIVVLAEHPNDLERRTVPDPGSARRTLSGSAMLPRHASPAEIDAAIRAAAAGLIVTHPMFADHEARVAGSHATAEHSLLTPREVEVLRMLAAGLPNKTIANRLKVSAHTVKFHVGSIMTKLHASSRTEAVTEGIRRGLIFV